MEIGNTPGFDKTANLCRIFIADLFQILKKVNLHG